MLYATEVINVTAGLLHGEVKTPWERLTGKIPDLRKRCIHVWGCQLSYGVTKAQRMAEEWTGQFTSGLRQRVTGESEDHILN